MTPKYRAALFDLDDTLLDHQLCRREALAAVAQSIPALSAVSVTELEAAHDAHWQRTYKAMLDGTLSVSQSRTERMRELLHCFGVAADDDLAISCEQIYREAYDRDWRPVPGSRELIASLRDLNVWIGVITNGLHAEQTRKLRILQMEEAIDEAFVSETVGAQKPEREFFQHVLGRCGFLPTECVVIGDLWETDIQGALNAGVDSIWLNRYGRSGERDASVVEVNSLLPTDTILRLFFKDAI